MKKLIYQTHLLLGIIVSVPVLAWALSGLLYAWPNAVEGGSVEKISAAEVTVSPADALNKANALAGRHLPITAVTLLTKDSFPQYQLVGGLGADSIYVNAVNGKAYFSEPPTLKTSFFRQAHFYFFAGEWQVPLLFCFSLLSALSAVTGIYLNIVHWRRKLFSRTARTAAAGSP